MIRDLLTAIGFLTVIPTAGTPSEKPGRAFAYFPLVGLVIGSLLWLTSLMPIDGSAGVFVTLLVWVVISGGLHLDGFADACDALLATVSTERRLAIMKDPQVGTWGAVGIILLLLGKFTLLQSIDPLQLIIIPMLARITMVIAAMAFPYARTEGLGAYFSNGLGITQLIMAYLFSVGGLVAFATLTGNWLIISMILVPVFTSLFGGHWASTRLGGGLTGDVYGGLCELSELIGLFCLMLVF